MCAQVAIKFETPLRGGEHLDYEAKVYSVINTVPNETHPPLFPAPQQHSISASSSSSSATGFTTNSQHVEGVPNIYWFGNEHNHNILVLELLGPSLEQLLTFCNHRFEPATILLLARQMLHRIR
jgi:hypothetical protein